MEIVYATDGRPLGHVERSSCGKNERLVISAEPYRTQLANLMEEYALDYVFGQDSLAIRREGEVCAVQARSRLEEGGLRTVAHLEAGEAGPTLELARIRPQYVRPKRRHPGHRVTKRPTLLVSACLLGDPCRYDGASKAHAKVQALAGDYVLVPVCPEVLGGLPTPRPPAERQGARVVNRLGEDVSDAYAKGAAAALRLAQENGCTEALLKGRSPSCGSGKIYDGSFTGTLCDGWGVAAEALRDAGIPVKDEDTWFAGQEKEANK